MFDNLPETKKVRNTRLTRFLVIAAVFHAIVFGVLGIASMFAVEAIEPPPITVVFLTAAAPPPPPPPPAPAKPKPKPVEEAPKPVEAPKVPQEVVQPIAVPEVAQKLNDAPEESGMEGGVDGGVEGGVDGGVAGGVPGGAPGGVEGGAGDAPLRVGGDVRPPQIVSQTQPRYPEVAKAARVQGVVILEAIINTEGQVEDVKVLRGQPLLDQAAMDAIVKWKFKPGTLNGKPVKVIFTLTVNFSLK